MDTSKLVYVTAVSKALTGHFETSRVLVERYLPSGVRIRDLQTDRILTLVGAHIDHDSLVVYFSK
jgi:hypothetical protein